MERGEFALEPSRYDFRQRERIPLLPRNYHTLVHGANEVRSPVNRQKTDCVLRAVILRLERQEVDLVRYWHRE